MSNVQHFFSCDWGTSSFRLRLVSRTDFAVVGVVQNGQGVREINARLIERGVAGDPSARGAAFGEVLAAAIVQLQRVPAAESADAPVIISGMASSTVGWRELGYARTPCPLDGSALRVESLGAVAVGDARHAVWMVSGLTTGADLMRGEESELLGVLAMPEFAGLRRRALAVLPGTHSKHVRIEDGAAVDFRTHMTGELLELLSTRSLLGVSVDWPPGEFEAAPFSAGVGLAREAGLGRGLFQVRVRSVLERAPRSGNAWFLAGLLIGSEAIDLLDWGADAPGGGDGAPPILLAASPRFATTYRLAIEQLGAGPRLAIATPDQLLQATLRAHGLLLERLGL